MSNRRKTRRDKNKKKEGKKGMKEVGRWREKVKARVWRGR